MFWRVLWIRWRCRRMLGAGVFAWSGVVVVCVAFGFICFVLFLFLFFSFFFFSLGIKGGLKFFLAVVQWVGSFGGLSRRLCPYNLTVMVRRKNTPKHPYLSNKPSLKPQTNLKMNPKRSSTSQSAVFLVI